MLLRQEHGNGVVTYQSPLLTDLGVPHAFSTRIGGVSKGPYASLNLGELAKDDATDANTAVAENYRRLREALGLARHVRSVVRQMHTGEVHVPPAGPIRPQDCPVADALVTEHPGLLLAVRVADCVPVLLADRSGRRVAAVHAGWRGVAAGVVTHAVGVMRERFGVRPGDLAAAIGPCISLQHFEVGPEVAEQFRGADLAAVIDEKSFAKPHVDLQQAVRLQLRRAGVSESTIDGTDRCTFEHAGEFFSHRRDRGVTGRLAAVIAVRG
ncbi:MAG: peptidoglycan editing factor PgeF [Phycisphaeraceae bacterium]|nr:peptidoglycan editing factor PgeF [Phycisphaeraceae bacterium]